MLSWIRWPAIGLLVLLAVTACKPRVPAASVANGPPPAPAENVASATVEPKAATAEVTEVPKEAPASANEAPSEVEKAAPAETVVEKPLPVDPVPDKSTELASISDSQSPATDSKSGNGQAAEKSVLSSGESNEPAEPRERVALLCPGGPLLIDIVLRFEGQDFSDALNRLVDDAYRQADEDGDGQTTWQQLSQNPRFRSGEFGNLVADTDEEVRQLIQIYDVDSDGLVDREELPRFLTRNAGGGRSFTLKSSNEYRSTNRRRSPTRLLIDADRDGAISAEEMEAAPHALLNRDSDSDEIVTLQEMKDNADQIMQPAMMPNRRRVTEPDTAIWLTDTNIDFTRRWGMVQFQLQELYSYGETLTAGDWSLVPELFKSLDSDNDEQLSKSEVSQLAEVPPHLILEVDFDRKSDDQPGPQLKLREIASELLALKPTIREMPSRISIQLSTTEIELFVSQDQALANVVQAAKSQFAAFDRDKNNYLEKAEVPEQVPGMDVQFEALDRDSDGKVYEADLITYLEQRSAVARAQVRARAADQEDALFTALDTDGDGRLNTREIRLCPSHLKSFDRNGDQQIQSDEIPGSMVVGLVRGNPQLDDQLFASPAGMTQPSIEKASRWFRGMDANSDGEISRREFFGTQDKFEKLDADHDGYVSLEEAAAFDASRKE